MFSLMWSEHCAYKHSKKLLRTLPTEGEAVVLGPGENAGAVDVGGGLVCAFKVESHNHPSAVEPFQGAATGVGGILRDIFALGARPVAVLDSLRFGEPSSARSRYLLDHAVMGIGHYGNSIGVPTVGGEVYFEAPYETNCLVNAMALGLAPRGRLTRSAAAGIGNVVVLFGASTGSRRHRRRVGPGQRRARRRRRRQAPDRPGRRPLRGEEAPGVLAGAARPRPARRAAGPRRGGADVERVGDGVQGRRRRRPRRRPACRCARPTWRPSRSWSPSRRSGCCASASPRASTRCSRCARAGRSTARRSARSPTRGSCASCATARSSARCPSPRSSTTAPSTTSRRRARPRARGRVPAARGDARRRGLPARRAARAAGRAERRLAPSPLRAVRPDRAVADPPPARGGRRGRARAPGRERARACRSTATAAGSPPTPTRGPSWPRWSARPTSPASGPHRSARRTTSTSATPRSRTWPGSSRRPCAAWATRAARSGRRSSAATSRSTTRAPTARSTRPRSWAWSAACPTRAARGGPASPATATPGALAGWNRMPSLAASELAKLRGEPLPDGLPGVDLEHCLAVLDAVRDAVRAGDLASCHDVAEGGFLVALAEACLLGGRRGGRRPCRGGGRDVDGRAALRRGRLRLPRVRARAWRSSASGSGSRSTCSGRRAATALVLDEGAGLRWSLEELRAAHGALGALFP